MYQCLHQGWQRAGSDQIEQFLSWTIGQLTIGQLCNIYLAGLWMLSGFFLTLTGPPAGGRCQVFLAGKQISYNFTICVNRAFH